MSKRIGFGVATFLLASCGSPDVHKGDFRAAGAVVEDFDTGVSAQNHPEGAGQYEVWYDATNDTFGTPSAASLDGAPAMRIDDGGFTNGVYAIFQAAVPRTGRYVLRVPVHVVEEDATAFDGVDTYQVGVAAGAEAVHRGPNPSDLAPLTVFGEHSGLTDGDDTAIGSVVVETLEFDASAGDDLLVAFGTDVQTGDWSADSGFWSGTYVVVGSIELVPVNAPDPGIIVDNDDGAPDYTQTGNWALSGGVGYNGGTYLFTSTGNDATARWAARVPAGFYEVDVVYRAGSNRAAAAKYSVEVAGETVLAKSVDQRFLDLSWVKLGLIDVAEDGEIAVELDAALSEPAGSVVIADAVRFVEVDGPPPIDPPELRLAAITVFDPISDVGAIEATVQQLADLHYNAIAVHARYRGDATYIPNKFDDTYPNLEPRNPQAGDVDVLEEFSTRGHNAGLKVFAYFNTHLVTSGVTEPTDPNHVVLAHPEWRTWAYNGGDPIVQTPVEDVEGLWLEPALPEVREYTADIVGDIALNYDIDGVILDRIRYPQTAFIRTDADFGYHPDAIASFNDEYDKVGLPDPYDPDWIEFRQIAITDSVGAIYNRLGEIDEDLVLLAYPIGRFSDAINFNYQDWPQWLGGRHIDGVLPQIYTADNFAFADRLEEHADAYGGDRMLGVTINAFSTGIDVAGQIGMAHQQAFDGTSPFRHGTMGPLGYLEDLETAWDGIAECPEMPWKGARIKRLRLRSTCSEDPSVERRWRVRNPNAWSIEATYWLLWSGQNGTFFAPPGDSFFVTETIFGFNIVVLSWFDHNGDFKWTVNLSFGQTCE